VQIDGDTIEGHYNGSNVAFIIQMESDGTVTLTRMFRLSIWSMALRGRLITTRSTLAD
jgi:hypothetical protein